MAPVNDIIPLDGAAAEPVAPLAVIGTFYVAGVPGLRRGDRVLPVHQTPSHVAAALSRTGEEGLYTDKATGALYCCNVIQAADFAAAMRPRDVVYLVEPEGRVEPAPARDGVYFRLSGARVLRVIPLSGSRRHRLLTAFKRDAFLASRVGGPIGER